MSNQDPELEDGLRESPAWNVSQVQDCPHPLLSHILYGCQGPAVPGPSTATSGGLDLPPAYS